MTIQKNNRDVKTNGLSQKDYDHIDLILNKAEGHGLKWEVERSAMEYINKYNNLNALVAYQWAFNDWIK